MGKSQGFTLTELLVSVTILSSIAAIAAPNLIDAVDRAKQKRTMAALRSIGTACEEYSLDNFFYPVASTQGNASYLSPYLTPRYMKVFPAQDGWGWNIQYGTSSGGTGYTVRSLGKDGIKNASPIGPSFDPNCDIVFQNGQFIAYPAGMAL